MGQLVQRLDTPLAPPGDHKGFSLALDKLLRANLPADLNTLPVRVRLIAHASWACGWNASETWHFNYWGVKKAGWTGDYYAADAPELDDQGNPYVRENDLWRAFKSPAESIADTVARLRAQPEAMQAALDPSEAADVAYVVARKKYHYFTDTLGHTQTALVSRMKMIRGFLGPDPGPESAGQAGYIDRDLLILAGVFVAAAILIALLIGANSG